MSTLDARIQIMRETGVISEDTANKIESLRRLFLEMYGIELTEENASSCVTHFCIALERLKTGEDIAPLSEAILEESEASDDYGSAVMIADNIFGLITPLTPNERDYVILHIIMVLSNVREEYDKKALSE